MVKTKPVIKVRPKVNGFCIKHPTFLAYPDAYQCAYCPYSIYTSRTAK